MSGAVVERRAGRPSLGARSSWIWVPLAIAVASRVLSIAIVLGIAWATGGHARGANPFALWDAEWYFGIARDGYHAALVKGGHDFAFFPAWPVLIRAVTTFGVPAAVGAVVLANVLFVAGAVLAWRAMESRFGAAVATRGLLLLACSPPAFVFSLAYSESLFLLAAGAYFAASRRSTGRIAAVAVGMLTRLAGVALIAAAFVRAVQDRGRERRVAIAAVLIGIAAFAAWWLFIAALTGDPMGYTKGSTAWIHEHPLTLLVRSIRAHPARAVAWVAFAAVVAVGTLLLVRRDLELAVFCAVVMSSVAQVFLPILAGGILHSVPRYAVIAFPAFAALGDRLGRRGTLALLAVFVVGQVLFASWVVPARGTQAP